MKVGGGGGGLGEALTLEGGTGMSCPQDPLFRQLFSSGHSLFQVLRSPETSLLFFFKYLAFQDQCLPILAEF